MLELVNYRAFHAASYAMFSFSNQTYLETQIGDATCVRLLWDASFLQFPLPCVRLVFVFFHASQKLLMSLVYLVLYRISSAFF